MNMMLLDTIMQEYYDLIDLLQPPKEDYPSIIASIVDPLELNWLDTKYLKERALLRRTPNDPT